MGFSIGNLIASIAPALGGALGGLPGLILGQGVRAGLTPPSPVGRATAPAPAPAVLATQTAPAPFQAPVSDFGGGNFRSNIFGAIPPAVRGAGAIIGGGAAAIATSFFNGGNGTDILARARANVRGATKKKIIAAAKACGIDMAANTFGLSDTDICQLIVSGTGRRRRGVSAADVRTTKRTLRFVKRIKTDLKAVRL